MATSIVFTETTSFAYSNKRFAKPRQDQLRKPLRGFMHKGCAWVKPLAQRKASQIRTRLSLSAARKECVETPQVGENTWFQKTVTLPSFPRGCHVITRKLVEQVPEISNFEVGMANFFIQHTSASLTINENASPDVPKDLNDSLDRIAPEGTWYRHLDEGPDDMPAHVKSSLMGPSLDVPVRAGRLALGTWQGLYLNEHRDHGGARSVVVTVQGARRADGRSYPPHQPRW
mmetsp:Transcript_21740/g.51950  ORF Transcript_21740/g.51950 Transcript_21740/m.51950 type:complete len:230 (-) Transcript_21740:66-755(-)